MKTTTTRPAPQFITEAHALALASGKFEPGRLARALVLANDPRSVVLPDGSVDVPTSKSFVVIKTSPLVGSCECADYLRPGAAVWCKHRIAACLLVRAMELEQAYKNAPECPKSDLPTQLPTPEPQRPTAPALTPVNPTSKPATATRRKSCRESDDFLLAYR